MWKLRGRVIIRHMAGKKQKTREKSSLSSKGSGSFSSQKYKKYLLYYAINRKRSIQAEKNTLPISKQTGTIFAGRGWLARLQFVRSWLSQWSHKTNHSVSTLDSTNSGYRGGSQYNTPLGRQTKNHRGFSIFIFLLFILKSIQNVALAIQQFFNLVTYPVRQSHRLIRRWNRKNSWSFKRKIKSEKIATKKSTPNPVAEFFLSLIRPFYYTVKLYPLHSYMALILSLGILGLTWQTNELIFKDLPDPHELSQQEPAVTTKIMDRNGEVLFRLYKDENRTIVPLSSISPDLIRATIAIEDQEFYDHRGFSVKGIARAFISNYQGLPTQGGSTLTQQLVKLRLLSSERTLQRKIREVILAILVEGIYSKDQILEMYLNQVSYGGSTYGIEEAAQKYFGKSAAELTLPESALLAGLPAAPSAYTPFGPTPEYAKARQLEVLRRMTEDGYITQEQADMAEKEQLAFKNDVIDITAPHFVMYVKKLLADKYGEDVILQGGLEITTTLDGELQDEVQQTVTDEVNSLERLKVSNGAALVTNPKTGEIFAMVGSKDYFDFEHDGQVNVTMRPRQPGSSIKPVTYALALSQGSTVSTIIQDQAITFNTLGSKPYSPKNYDGKFHGNVTLKEALASSYNIPAVKLLNQVGVDNMIDLAEKMGITTWKDRSRFGLSLTLGGGEVLMTDMAKVYGAFANEGYSTDLNPILEIKNYKGEVLYRNTCALDNTGCYRKKVLDTKVAYLISNILSDNAARTPAFGPLSTLVIPNQEVAVKTGTTNNLRDNWTFGYTSDRLVAVWVGNNDNTSMSYVASGVTGASSIWNTIMRSVLDDGAPHRFAIPPGIVKTATCISTGSAACSGCANVKQEYYIAGTEPKSPCNLARTLPKQDPSSATTNQVWVEPTTH